MKPVLLENSISCLAIEAAKFFHPNGPLSGVYIKYIFFVFGATAPSGPWPPHS